MLIPAQPAPAPPFSSLRSLSSHYLLLPSHFLPPGGAGAGVLPRLRRGDLAIRMGGGPRTYPGGVSKWQWKRMQAKKARQLLKARLARERQLFEMRKRAELRDAVAHLERPWDPDSAGASAVAPNLLSVAAEDQLRALADRFHRPGGVDLWNDRDGPRVFASPATGAASARFFPRNAFHSIQPYALVGAGAGGEANAQGVRENAAEDDAYSGIADRQPAVELTEKDDGTWEPVNASDADDSTAGDWTSDDDDHDDNDAISESEGMGAVGSWREQRSMIMRNGRSNGVARWEAAGAMAAGIGNDRGRSGDAFSSDSERARGHRDHRWQERSTSANPRKQAGGRWSDSKTTAGTHVRQRGRTGAGSVSESEVIRGGSEPKWRASKGKRDDTRNVASRWSAPKKDWMGGDGFDSESDSARGRELEPRRGARNKMNGSDNLRGRSKSNYSANANGGEKLLKYLRGDQHSNSSNGFAEDLEAPKWKPRRMNRGRNNNGGRDDDMGGRFRRGEDGASGRLRVNHQMNNRGDGSGDGGRKTGRNGGRRLWGDEYSLRPTSELRGSWPETG